MKLTILQQDLLPVLQSVSRSCGVRSTLPVLANILLETEDNTLKLSATNLEIGVVRSVKAQVADQGSITVPARTFLEIVSSLPQENIDIESGGDQLKITTSKFSGTLNGIPSTEFPAIPLSSENPVLVEATAIKGGLPQISFAAASDEGRPILTGILTEIKKGTLEMVATDGFRLAHKTTKLNHREETAFRSLIPRRTFEEVVKLIAEEGEVESIEISTSENQMIFRINQTLLSSRLIEGQFPSWEKIIPESAQNRTIVDRQEFLKGVKLASVFAKDSANIVKIEAKAGGLKLTSEARELGTQESEIDASVEGDEVQVAFNSRYITEAVSACSASQIAIEFSGNLSAALIKPVGDEGLEYVIMPVRLS